MPDMSRLAVVAATPRTTTVPSIEERNGGVRLDDLSKDRFTASFGKACSLHLPLFLDYRRSICMTLAWVLLACESMAAPACTSML
mgnify:CR=1 FL=1